MVGVADLPNIELYNTKVSKKCQAGQAVPKCGEYQFLEEKKRCFSVNFSQTTHHSNTVLTLHDQLEGAQTIRYSEDPSSSFN